MKIQRIITFLIWLIAAFLTGWNQGSLRMFKQLSPSVDRCVEMETANEAELQRIQQQQSQIEEQLNAVKR